VAFELLGDELCKARQRALPHFRPGDADDHLIIGFDEHPRADLGAAIVLCAERIDARHKETEREAATGGRGTDQDFAAGEFQLVRHVSLLSAYACPAALCTAARMRW